MSVRWKCDVCGKDTWVNPPTETIFEEIEVDKKKVKVPKKITAKTQDPFTGEIKDIPIHAQRDLKPRAYMVKLSIGGESVQRDFCKECLEHFKPELNGLFDRLAKVESK